MVHGSRTPHFPDWMNPVWVKEWRQEFRLRRYFTVLIILHIMMVIAVVLGFESRLAPEKAFARDIGEFIIWCGAVFFLVLYLPSLASQAMSREIQDNTMELLLVTRLSARAILFGKWLALFSVGVLFTVSVIPYQLILHLAGGGDLSSELLLLLTLLMASGSFTMICVAGSVFKRSFLRGLTSFALLLALYAVAMVAIHSIGTPSGAEVSQLSSLLTSAWAFIALIILSILTAWLAFEYAVSKIAFNAWNHLLAIRTGGLIVPLFLLISLGAQGAFAVSMVIGTPLLFLICTHAMLTPSRAAPEVWEHFARHGTAGKIAGFFLAPGLHTGFRYSVVVWTIYGVLALAAGFRDPIVLWLLLSLTVQLFLGPALVQLLRKFTTNAFGIMAGQIGLQLALAILLLVLLAGNFPPSLALPFAVLPFTDLLLTEYLSPSDLSRHMALTALTGVVCLAYLAFRAAPGFLKK